MARRGATPYIVRMKRIALAAALILCAVPASAQSLVSTGQSFADARLLPGRGGQGVQVVGLDIALAPGWKTYWRSPGEAGIPPSFDWSGSENLGLAEVLWPAPHAFDSFGIRTIGYKGRVILPVRITPLDPALPVRLRLAMTFGVCETICVLEETVLGADFMPGEDGVGAVEVAAAELTVPRPGLEMGVTHAACGVRGAGQERDFAAELAMSGAPEGAIVLVEGPEEAWIGEATATKGATGLSITAPVSVLDPDAWIDRGDLRITVLGDGYAADITGCAPLGS